MGFSAACEITGRRRRGLGLVVTSLVPGAEEERLVHTDALPVN